MLSEAEVSHFKSHQNEITPELLSALRALGKEGKQQALDILDMPKDADGYYLDGTGKRLSYAGNRKLKDSFAKFKIYPIHIEELKKCMDDILYFLDNYIKLTTPKDGVNFVDTRQYQRDFLTLLCDDSVENIISMQPRQSSKSTTTSVKLAHLFCFKFDLTIGIVAYSGAASREFLDKTKKMLLELPVWMTPGIVQWNKGSIECENNVRILTDVPKGDSFRGFSCHVIVVDECIDGSSTITIRNPRDGSINNIKIEDFYIMLENKEKILEHFKKLDCEDEDKLLEYVDFCLIKGIEKTHLCTDEHHILPQGSELFPELSKESWNKVHLTYKDHYIAHSILALAFPKNNQIVFAWNSMTNMYPEFKRKQLNENPLKPETYDRLRKLANKKLSEINKGITCVKSKRTGKYVRIPVEEYRQNKELYIPHNTGKIKVTDPITGERIWVTSEEYKNGNFISHTSGMAKFLNTQTMKTEWIKSVDRKDYHIFVRTKILVSRNEKNIEIMGKEAKEGDVFIDTIKNLNKIKGREESLKNAEIRKFRSIERAKIRKEKSKKTAREKYLEERKLAFAAAGKEYKYRTPIIPLNKKNQVAAYDKCEKKNCTISSEEFYNNPDRYTGIAKGLIGIIGENGEIKRIPKSEYDPAVHKMAPCGGFVYKVYKNDILIFEGIMTEVVNFFKVAGIPVTSTNIRTAASREPHTFYKLLNLPEWKIIKC